jgi:hypothetical protein
MEKGSLRALLFYMDGNISRSGGQTERVALVSGWEAGKIASLTGWERSKVVRVFAGDNLTAPRKKW